MSATGSACSAAGRGCQGGFTLVELLVVMALVAMIAVSFPFLVKTMVPSQRMRAAVEEFSMALRKLQMEAVLDGSPVRVSTSEAGYSVWRSQRTEPENLEMRRGIRLSLESAVGGRAPRDLSFYPDGSSTGGRFVLRDGKRQALVEVSFISGRVVEIPQ